MKVQIGLFLLISLFPISAFAQVKADISSICQGKDIPKNLIILDQGFCDEFLKVEVKDSFLALDKGIEVNASNCAKPVAADKWKFRLYASNSFTTYFNTNMKINSRRYKVEIKDYEWAERGSRDFFIPKTWFKTGNNPAQMIDEPSNTFTASIEKNGHEFFISAFHSKYLQAPGQVKYIKGTVDGVAVDGHQEVNKPFDGYNQTPGETELIGNQNTHRQYTFEVGYGHRFKLLNSRFGSITYIPSISFGVMAGHNSSAVVKENEWWESDHKTDSYGIEGYGGSITNRLELNLPKERFGIFVENKFAHYEMNHGFQDGTQKYDLNFMGNSVGMKMMIYNPNNRKKKVPKG